MKTINKMFVITVIAAVNLFSITACAEEQQQQQASTVEFPYVGNTLIVSGEKVWEQTVDHKISGAYAESTVTSGVSIVTLDRVKIGTGNIINGFLSFSVSDPGAENLLAWDDLKKIFYEWTNVTIDDPTANGNVITLITDTNAKLSKGKLYGTNTQLDMDNIMYIYVDKDCRITGDKSEGEEPGVRYWYTIDILDLSFKKGWNLLCRREYYDNTSGKDAVSMEIKQLVDFRWVIWP